MNIFTKWLLPVTVSLLLHAILIALVSHQLTNTSQHNNPLQAISVELQGLAPAPQSKPRIRKEKPVLAVKPLQEYHRKEQIPVVGSVQSEQESTTTIQEQTTPPQPDSTATASQQPGLNLQPLSKLTRQPAFLQKIEPVYPGSEQRAGSQAQVIAELTIDTNGKVQRVNIVKSAGIHFDNAVIEALNKSMFTPGYINREAVAVRVLVPFRFNLK